MVEAMIVPATRAPSPEDPGARALLERQIQPLYSSGVLNAGAVAPREILFFNYAQGSQISGAGIGAVGINATSYHTSMRTANLLGKPKVFVYRGIRVLIYPIVPEVTTPTAPTLTDPSLGTIGAGSDQLDDLKLLWYTGLLRFEIAGLKPYLEVPLLRVPGNAGIKGVAAHAGTGAASLHTRTEVFYSAGQKLHIYDEVLIPSMQAFSVAIRWHQAITVTPVDHKMILVLIVGEHGRETL